MKIQRPDVWPNRVKFRQLAERERAKLHMQPGDYWDYLAAIVGKTPRTIRSYATDRAQAPGTEVISKLAEHYGIHYNELERPTIEERRLAQARFGASLNPVIQVEAPKPAPAPEPSRPKFVTPAAIERADLLKDLVGKLNTLELVHLKFTMMLLEPYWELFGIKKS